MDGTKHLGEDTLCFVSEGRGVSVPSPLFSYSILGMAENIPRVSLRAAQCHLAVPQCHLAVPQCHWLGDKATPVWAQPEEGVQLLMGPALSPPELPLCVFSVLLMS